MYQQTNVPIADTYSQTSQNYYFVGGGINLPLYHIFNYSNRVKQQKLYTEAQKQIRDQKMDEIKVMVVSAYFDAQAELSLLPHIIENMQLAQSQYDEAKLNFINLRLILKSGSFKTNPPSFSENDRINFSPLTGFLARNFQ